MIGKCQILYTMKKLLILFSFFLGIGSANAQTAEQTIEWLQAKVPSLQKDSDFAKGIKFKDEFCESASSMITSSVPTRFNEFHVFKYSKIKSISSLQKEIMGKLCYKIIITGNFQANEIGDNNDVISTKSIESTDFVFNPTVEKDEILRIVKALKHLATIKGAKLLDDNLF